MIGKWLMSLGETDVKAKIRRVCRGASLERRCRKLAATENLEETLTLVHPEALKKELMSAVSQVIHLVAQHVRRDEATVGKELEDCFMPTRALRDHSIQFDEYCEAYRAAQNRVGEAGRFWGEVGKEVGDAFGVWAGLIGAMAGGCFGGARAGKSLVEPGERLEKSFQRLVSEWEVGMEALANSACELIDEFEIPLAEEAGGRHEEPIEARFSVRNSNGAAG